MTLNCRPGDIAIVVRRGLAYGYIVTCLSRYDGPWREGNDEPGWRVDHALPADNGEKWQFVADKNLRPIRDSEGEDEVLRLVGLPAGALHKRPNVADKRHGTVLRDGSA